MLHLGLKLQLNHEWNSPGNGWKQGAAAAARRQGTTVGGSYLALGLLTARWARREEQVRWEGPGAFEPCFGIPGGCGANLRDTSEDLNERFTYSFLGIFWCHITLSKVDLGLQIWCSHWVWERWKVGRTVAHIGPFAWQFPRLWDVWFDDLMDVYSGKFGFWMGLS